MNNNKDYWVKFSMGIYSDQVEVKADTPEDALEKAEKIMDNMVIMGSDIEFERSDIVVFDSEEEADNA